MRRAVLALVLALAAGACSLEAVGETTTAVATTTTTVAPATTSTSTMSTTIAATTTLPSPSTTAVPPVYEPTGKIKVDGEILALGYVDTETGDLGSRWAMASGLLLDVSVEVIPFTVYSAGTDTFVVEPREVVVLTIAFGNGRDDPGQPFVRRVWLGRPGAEGVIGDEVAYGKLHHPEWTPGASGDTNAILPVYLVAEDLILHLDEQPQLVVWMPTLLPDEWWAGCAVPKPDWTCEIGLTYRPYVDANSSIVEDLVGLPDPEYQVATRPGVLGFSEQVMGSIPGGLPSD